MRARVVAYNSENDILFVYLTKSRLVGFFRLSTTDVGGEMMFCHFIESGKWYEITPLLELSGFG